MILCSNGHTLDPDHEYCPYCGAPAGTTKCASGHQVDAVHQFCPKCGDRLTQVPDQGSDEVELEGHSQHQGQSGDEGTQSSGRGLPLRAGALTSALILALIALSAILSAAFDDESPEVATDAESVELPEPTEAQICAMEIAAVLDDVAAREDLMIALREFGADSAEFRITQDAYRLYFHEMYTVGRDEASLSAVELIQERCQEVYGSEGTSDPVPGETSEDVGTLDETEREADADNREEEEPPAEFAQLSDFLAECRKMGGATSPDEGIDYSTDTSAGARYLELIEECWQPFGEPSPESYAQDAERLFQKGKQICAACSDDPQCEQTKSEDLDQQAEQLANDGVLETQGHSQDYLNFAISYAPVSLCQDSQAYRGGANAGSVEHEEDLENRVAEKLNTFERGAAELVDFSHWDAGNSLNVVLGRVQEKEGADMHAFFFTGEEELLGTDTYEPSRSVSIVEAGDTHATLAYDLYEGGSAIGESAHVTFEWDGDELDAIGDIPPRSGTRHR